MANYKMFYLEGMVTLLGELISEDDYSVTFSEPQIVMVTPNGVQTQNHFGLIEKKEITFRKSELMCNGELFEPNPQFLQHYLANKAGIQVAGANEIPRSSALQLS